MFVSNVPSSDHEAFPSADLLDDLSKLLFNVFVSQYLASVLWCPHQVVFTDIGTMAELVDSSVCHDEIALGYVCNEYRPKVILYCFDEIDTRYALNAHTG